MKKLSLICLLILCVEILNAQKVTWQHQSTANNHIELPFANANMQTSCVVTDLNNDGVNDIVVTCRNATPAIAAYIRKEKNWQKQIIEPQMHTIEAGGTHYDVDADGDEDLIFGGDWQSNEIWWWQNPQNATDKTAKWQKRTIKKSGKNQHHDLAFGDFKHAGKAQLAFWNQGSKAVFIADIPTDPTKTENWEFNPVLNDAAGNGTPYPEGMAVADLDSDGWPDLLAGNTWLKYNDSTKKFNPVKFANYGGRLAVGRLKAGKMQQIVIAPGDGSGALKWYECVGKPEDPASWKEHVLIDRDLVHAHTLAIADVNKDGHLDIFTAEMAKWTEKSKTPDNANAEALIFYGNGTGNFKKESVMKGFGFHEGKIADADADGDEDIISKPYNWKTPRLDVWLQNGTGEKLAETGKALNGKLGLELYSLREYLKKDIPGTLKKIKEMGITEVEIPEFYGLTAKAFKAELDKANLTYPSMLWPYEKLRDSLDGVINDCKTLGLKYAGCAWIPRETTFTREMALAAADVFNKAGERMKKEGIRFFYHPHGYEFVPSKEGTLMDVLASAMKPGIADFELDILWSHYGGEDPVAFMNKHKGRILLMHVKDLRHGEPVCNYDTLPPQDSDVAVGKGQLNISEIMRMAVKQGVKHYFIEDESTRVLEQIPETIKFVNAIK